MTCETCPDTILCWQNVLLRCQCYYCQRWEVVFYDEKWAKMAVRYGKNHAVVRRHKHVHVRSCPPSVGASRMTRDGDPMRFCQNNTICRDCRKKYHYPPGDAERGATYIYDD